MIHALLPRPLIVVAASVLLSRFSKMLQCGHLVCSPSQRHQLIMCSLHVPISVSYDSVCLSQPTAAPRRGFRCSGAGKPPANKSSLATGVTRSPEAPALPRLVATRVD